MSKEKEYYWENPNWDAYKDKLIERLKSDKNVPVALNDAYYDEIATEALHKINPILEKNLVEYINGEPLSQIEVGTNKYTATTILSLRKYAGGVIEALKDLSVYSVDEEQGSMIISRRFTIM